MMVSFKPGDTIGSYRVVCPLGRPRTRVEQHGIDCSPELLHPELEMIYIPAEEPRQESAPAESAKPKKAKKVTSPIPRSPS